MAPMAPMARRAPMAALASRPHPRGVDLSAHADQALGSAAGASIERHLRTCARCAATVLAYRGIGGRLRRLPEVPAPPGLGDALGPTRLRSRTAAGRPGHAATLRRVAGAHWTAAVSVARRALWRARSAPGAL